MKDKETWNPSLYECRSCGDVIYSSYPGEFVTCKCFENSENNKGIAIDQTEHYTRHLGEPNNFIYRERLYNGN